MLARNEHDPLAEYVDAWYERAGIRTHSLRSRKGGVDVSTIALSHGGGGHPAAAGYSEPAAA